MLRSVLPLLLSAFAIAGLLWPSTAHAQPAPANLNAPSPSARVTVVRHCKERGEYRLTLADGTSKAWAEYDVTLKVDTTRNGPPAGTAVWLPTRSMGDRIHVIFAGVDELKLLVQPGC